LQAIAYCVKNWHDNHSDQADAPDRASGEIPGSTGGKFIFEMIEAAIISAFVAKHKLTRDEAR
jgi:hypothetical protein